MIRLLTISSFEIIKTITWSAPGPVLKRGTQLCPRALWSCGLPGQVSVLHRSSPCCPGYCRGLQPSTGHPHAGELHRRSVWGVCPRMTWQTAIPPAALHAAGAPPEAEPSGGPCSLCAHGPDRSQPHRNAPVTGRTLAPSAARHRCST